MQVLQEVDQREGEYPCMRDLVEEVVLMSGVGAALCELYELAGWKGGLSAGGCGVAGRGYRGGWIRGS